MPLPLPAEYDDAVQNPRSAFSDPELQSAVNDGPLIMGSRGPVASGNFAIVYKFRAGHKNVAVKCFTREKTDQQLRYKLIYDHLKAKNLPWMVDFTFLPDGVRVKGKIYPVVKMQWISAAKTLQTHIMDCLQSGGSLDEVKEQFYNLTADLRNAKIAHGDLQHANLIVSDGKLRLIDYDGMCVPTTVGFNSEEDGLRDYQHPTRRGGTLQLHLDNFPPLVIWASLHALTIDPSLWKRKVGDAGRLLFTHHDFQSPTQSGLFRELFSYKDERLNTVLNALISALGKHSLDQLPHLVDVISSERSTLAPGPSWWTSEVPRTKPDDQEQNGHSRYPDWIYKAPLVPLRPVLFSGLGNFMAGWFAISLAFLIIDFILLFGGTVQLLLAISIATAITLSSLGVLWVAYKLRPETRKKLLARENSQVILSKLDGAASELTSKETYNGIALATMEKPFSAQKSRLVQLESKIGELEKQSKERQRSFDRSTRDQRDKCEADRASGLRVLQNKRAAAKSVRDSRLAEGANLARMADSQFNQSISSLANSRDQKIKNRLSARCAGVILTELKKRDVYGAAIAGLNVPGLRRCGINTAADFSDVGSDGSLKLLNGKYVKVTGVGWSRGSALIRWRERMIKQVSDSVLANERDSVAKEVDAECQKEQARLIGVRDLARKNAETRACVL